MKKKQKVLVLAMVCLLAVASCATYVYSTITKTGEVPYAAELQGKSLSVVPFEIEFITDSPITIEGLKINGQYVSRYAYEDKDVDGNAFGAMRMNLFKKANVNAVAIQNESVKLLTSILNGSEDYTAGFFSGLGEGNSGLLSNRPIDYNRDVYPTTMFFKDAPLPSYYTSIKTILNAQSATTDLVMTGKIRINSEIHQYKGTPFISNLQVVGPAITQDGYVVSVEATIEFKIVNVKTGKTILTEKTKFPYPMNMNLERVYSLQIANKAAYDNPENFDTLNYTSQAQETVKVMLMKAAPYLAPFFINYQHAEEVKE